MKSAVVSCHVECLLDDDVWDAYLKLIRSPPGRVTVTSLLRPPAANEARDRERWVARARKAQSLGPVGHHSHYGGVTTARPVAGGEPPATLVRKEADWLRSHGLEPRIFCGGGWYVDLDVASVLAEYSYADCTALAMRPAYLADSESVLTLDEASWLEVDGETHLLAVPTTHSVGAFWRGVRSRSLPPVVHLYFHDYDLLEARRRRALAAAMRWLALRGQASTLEHYAERVAVTAGVVQWPDLL